MEAEVVVDESTVQVDPKKEAIARFKELMAKYGQYWNSQTPKEAYDALRECNKYLTERDRTEALASLK